MLFVGHTPTLAEDCGPNSRWAVLWQVRMASSVATRQFMMTLEKGARSQFFGELLPRMVLNRCAYASHEPGPSPLPLVASCALPLPAYMCSMFRINGSCLYCLSVHGVCLPRRYYVAEGVRLYSQATWAQVGGEQGKQYVQEHIGAVVEYYAKSADADNHAVREAACACIAELGIKVGTSRC